MKSANRSFDVKFFPILIEKDTAYYNKRVRNGFLAITIYAIVYGVYEYFVVYHYPAIIYTTALTNWMNWSIMIIGVLIVSGIVTRMRIESMFMGILYMGLLEDLVYWMCQWIDMGIFPFPCLDWWTPTYASFRVLKLGYATGFWPYIPRHYYVGFPLIIIYYLAVWKSPQLSRIVAWIIGPVFLALIVGTMVQTDQLAWIILITIPLVLYTYVGVIFLIHRNRKT